MKKKEFLILLFLLIAMASRFLFIVDGQSILPNFTAIGAIAIFGAVYLKSFKKWIYPLLALWVTDLVLNNVVYASYYDHFKVLGNFWVYGSLIAIAVMATRMMKKPSWTRLALTSVAGAVVFFLVTNFGVWAGGAGPYTKDIAGLIDCYAKGIPFFRFTLLGNLFYGFALFGIYEYLAARMKDLDPVLLKKSAITA